MNADYCLSPLAFGVAYCGSVAVCPHVAPAFTRKRKSTEHTARFVLSDGAQSAGSPAALCKHPELRACHSDRHVDHRSGILQPE